MLPRRALAFVLTLLAAALAVAGASWSLFGPEERAAAPSATPRPDFVTARLMVSLPRAGAVRARHADIANAVRLAVAELDGRLDTERVRYTLEVTALDSASDGAWSDAAERANAEQAAADASVIAYIGPGTAEALGVVVPIAARAGFVVISPTLTEPSLTKPEWYTPAAPSAHPINRGVFARVIPPDPAHVTAVARYAKAAGLSPAFAQADDTAYGERLWGFFVDTARRIGLETLDPRDQRLRLLYLGGSSTEGMAQRVIELKKERPGLTIAGGDRLLSDTLLARVGPPAEGLLAAYVGRPPEAYTDDAALFLRAYRDRFGSTPDPLAIFGYEAARLAIDALRRGGPDRAKVRDAVFATKDLRGALGTWSIDPLGDTTYATHQLYQARRLPDGRLAWIWVREIAP